MLIHYIMELDIYSENFIGLKFSSNKINHNQTS
jgi:hypothetical protein